MVTDWSGKFNIILASSSPRRRQLLEEAGIHFVPATVECEETWPQHLRGRHIAEYLAGLKADHWSGQLNEHDIVVTADTVVWCRGTFLGKPAGHEQAVSYLRLLSGCRHDVITGLCLRDSTRRHVFSVTTKVTFRKLSEAEIQYYAENFRPFDKAGAYGIQEWIGLRGITRIEGSYYNVVGMPVSELLTELNRFIKNK